MLYVEERRCFNTSERCSKETMGRWFSLPGPIGRTELHVGRANMVSKMNERRPGLYRSWACKERSKSGKWVQCSSAVADGK